LNRQECSCATKRDCGSKEEWQIGDFKFQRKRNAKIPLSLRSLGMTGERRPAYAEATAGEAK